MKSNITKKLLIISSIGVITGIILISLGFLLGSKPGFYLDRSGIKLYDEKAEVNTILNSFKKVSIDVSFTNIEIIKSDTNKMTYHSSDGLKISHKIVDEQLIIEQEYQSSIINLKLGLDKINTLKIYVKDEISLDINLNVGGINIDDVKIDKLTIDTDVSDIKINSNQILDMKIENKIGDITITSQTKKADIESIVGDVFYKVTDNLKNYNYETEALFERKKIVNKSDNQFNNVKIKTTIGNISIKSYENML